MSRILYPQLQQPVLTTGQQPEQVTESRWHQPWSEPVRFKRDPRASAPLAPYHFYGTLKPVVSFGWMEALSEPVRQPNGIKAQQQPYFYFTDFYFGEFVSPDKWNYHWSEPIHLKVRITLKAYLQSTTTVDPDYGIRQPRNQGYIIC